MRVAIVGSRRRHDQQTIVDYVNNLDPGDTVVSGGCEGPDVWAAEAAIKRGMKFKVFYPNMKGATKYYEKVKRYYERNEQIVLNSDMVVAFVAKDRKGGTENTIKWAQKHGKPVFIINEA